MKGGKVVAQRNPFEVAQLGECIQTMKLDPGVHQLLRVPI